MINFIRTIRCALILKSTVGRKLKLQESLSACGVLALSFVLLSTLPSAVSVAYGQQTSFLAYEDRFHGVRIQYPAGWEVTEDDQPVDVVFRSPAGDSSPDYTENLNINIDYIPAGFTLDEYTQLNIEDLSSQLDTQVSGSSDFTLSGKPGKKLEINKTLQGVEIRSTLVFLVENSRAYVITYDALAETYDQYLPVADQMIASVEISEPIEAENEGYVAFLDKSELINLEYPADWDTNENVRPDNIVTFTNLAEPRVTMGVDIQDVPGMTLEEYTDMSIDQLRAENIEPAFSETTISTNTPAGALEYVLTTTGGSENRVALVYAVNDGKAFVFFYIAHPDTWNTYFETSQTVFDSFSLVNEEVSGSVPLPELLTAHAVSISASAEPIELNIRSSSTVSDFVFSEESKMISFSATGEDGTKGVTVVTVGAVLEGPYTVMVDGTAVTDFKTTETAGGEAEIEVTYDHSTREINITGTQVVPEFPVTMLIMGIAIATIISLSAVMTKRKGIGFSGMMPK